MKKPTSVIQRSIIQINNGQVLNEFFPVKVNLNYKYPSGIPLYIFRNSSIYGEISVEMTNTKLTVMLIMQGKSLWPGVDKRYRTNIVS